MTTEERFTKIENAILALTETQARHELQMEKQSAGIRDLIVVSRTLVDTVSRLSEAQSRTDAQIQELRQAQKHTDEKLNALIDTVGPLNLGRATCRAEDRFNQEVRTITKQPQSLEKAAFGPPFLIPNSLIRQLRGED